MFGNNSEDTLTETGKTLKNFVNFTEWKYLIAFCYEDIQYVHLGRKGKTERWVAGYILTSRKLSPLNMVMGDTDVNSVNNLNILNYNWIRKTERTALQRKLNFTFFSIILKVYCRSATRE